MVGAQPPTFTLEGRDSHLDWATEDPKRQSSTVGFHCTEGKKID